MISQFINNHSAQTLTCPTSGELPRLLAKINFLLLLDMREVWSLRYLILNIRIVD